MKCISLWQPWASLIACGAKRYETRSWAPPRALIGQRIAIHAAQQNIHRSIRDVSRGTARAIEDALTAAGHQMVFYSVGRSCDQLPRGAIICTALLAQAWQEGGDGSRFGGNGPDLFGDYSLGRWIWRLTDVTPLPEPVPFKGRQGFFDVPDELLGVGK